MIQVLDDVLPKNLADLIENTTTSPNFPWYLLRDINYESLNDEKFTRAYTDDFIVNTIQLGHGVYAENDDTIQSTFFDVSKQVVDMVVSKLNMNCHLLRIKYNMLFNHTNNVGGKYNTPHIDNELPNSYSMIYYVNDSDGDTIIFDEIWDKNKRPENLKILQRITPKKNRAVVFPGNIFHTSSNPINNEKRIIMNVNFINE